MRHFNVDTIAGQWKYHVLKIIQNGEYNDSKIKMKALDTVAKLYKENKRFFFNVGDSDINSTKGIIRYLGRYRARSPVAEYKITEIDDGKVTFFFNDLANNKKKTYITNEFCPKCIGGNVFLVFYRGNKSTEFVCGNA